MATKIQGITIEIGGDTSPLAKAFAEANKSISTTQAELRNVEKALKLNPDSVILLTQKHKLLEDQIVGTSQKVVKLKEIEQELQRRREADPSNANLEKQLRAVQREMLNTESGLRKLQDEYENTGKSVKALDNNVDESAKKHETFKERLSDVWEGLKNFVTGNKEASEAVEESATEINSKIEIWDKFSSAIGNAAKKLFDLVTNAAAKADDLNTLAAKTGLTTEELQKMEYAASFVDVEVETMTGSMTKLVKNMDTARKGTGEAAEAFRKLHIRITQNGGKLRDSNEVFYETIDALGRIQNTTERDAIAMAVFGKSAQDLNPLIEAGSEQLKALGIEAENAGIIMSQETLDGANRFNDSIEKLKLTLEGVANAIGSELAENLAELAEKLTPLIVAIAKLLGYLSKIPTEAIIIIGVIIMVITLFSKFSAGVGTVKGVISDQFNPATAQMVANILLIVGAVTILIGAIIMLVALLAALSDKTENVSKVKGYVSEMTDSVGGIGQISSQTGISNLQSANANINSYANGTNYHPGGVAFITEFAPEQLSLPNGTNMVVMPRGTRVDPNVSVGAGGGDTFNVTIDAKNIEEFNDIVRLAKQARQQRRAR